MQRLCSLSSKARQIRVMAECPAMKLERSTSYCYLIQQPKVQVLVKMNLGMWYTGARVCVLSEMFQLVTDMSLFYVREQSLLYFQLIGNFLL